VWRGCEASTGRAGLEWYGLASQERRRTQPHAVVQSRNGLRARSRLVALDAGRAAPAEKRSDRLLAAQGPWVAFRPFRCRPTSESRPVLCWARVLHDVAYLRG